MDHNLNPVALTRKLLSFNTINPPGDERDCAEFCGSLLEKVGYRVSYYEFADKRTSLIAQMKTAGTTPAICFTGHLDTIPLGTAEWQKDPFHGQIDGDKIYGRGSSDMKAAVAAMLLMALNLRQEKVANIKAPLTLVLTAGEETACEGAHYIAKQENVLGQIGALIVGEPTANYPIIGHKGSIRLRLTTRGVTAHASMPELGDNAIHKAARVISKLQNYDFELPAHPLLGAPTLNIGTIAGGMNINSVPDKTTLGIDIRTIPGKSHQEIQASIQEAVGADVEVECLEQARSIETDANHPWVQRVFGIMTKYIDHHPEPKGVSYFTDASALTPAFGFPPTIILGPGEPGMAHKTDEYCSISKLEQAVQIYTDIALDWCARGF